MSSQFGILLQVVEAACAVGAITWVFALLTWRRALALRALAFLLASVVLLIILGAPSRAIASAIVYVLSIALLEIVQRSGRTSE